MIGLTALLITLMAIISAHADPSHRRTSGAGVVGISLGAGGALALLAALELTAGTHAP